MKFNPQQWTLDQYLKITAEIDDTEFLRLIQERFNVRTYILNMGPGYRTVWNKNTGDVELQEDISYHGTSVWEGYDWFTLSPTENEFLIALEKLLKKKYEPSQLR